jgi:hypothetical protein
LRGLQQVNPGLHGIVFDRLDVASDVADAIASSEFADRTEVVGGDFFQAVPPADLYLLKSVLHDWDDASCVQILSRCMNEASAADFAVLRHRGKSALSVQSGAQSGQLSRNFSAATATRS